MLHIKSACANITKICPLNCDKRASTQHCLGSMASNSTSASDSHPPQTPYSTGQINSRFKIFAGGRPLRRRREMVPVQETTATRDPPARRSASNGCPLGGNDNRRGPGGRPLRRHHDPLWLVQRS